MTATQPQDLTLEDVSRRFGPVVALDRTTLTIAAGELISLLGPSGCGKTTTLRIIAGFETSDTGRILVGGKDITDLPPNRRRLGMVFQDYSLFPHMTIAQNVSFGLRMAKLAQAEIAERTRRILDLVRLPGFDDRFPHQLSGGQQQRVALARSLVTNPSILLLDEPLGALDKNLRESMQFELRRIQQSLGITTVMVTHDQEEALTLSDRIAVMDRGRILQVGSPTDVYDRPRTRFVSEFLGTANLFVGHMARNGNGDDRPLAVARLENGEKGMPILIAPQERRGAGEPVVIAVRPEKMQLTNTRNAADNAFEAEIVGHVFRGTHHAYQVRLPEGQGEVFVYRQAHSRDGEPVLAAGGRAWVSWSANDSIVVEPEP